MSAMSRQIQVSRRVPADEPLAAGASAPAFARTLAVAAASLATLMWLASCATDRLAPAAPKGVDLTGVWQLDPNLSDDPAKPPPDDTTNPSEMRHKSGRGRVGLPPLGNPGGAGGPTGGPPPGTDDFTSKADASGGAYVPTLWQIPGGAGGNDPASAGASPSGSGGATGGKAKARRANYGHWLDAPDRMKIEQSGGKLTIQSKMPSGELQTDEFVSGHTSNIPIGQSTAERDVGWRDNIFVVDTKVKSGPTMEEDYALDDEGHLIMSTFMTGGHMPKADIKRVYDRVTGGQAAHP
jgi:hypothetical protein